MMWQEQLRLEAHCFFAIKIVLGKSIALGMFYRDSVGEKRIKRR
tara:strand:- start:297 stop:428 length:132 start_codon:yes stop_codon:yes gene_type:complete